MNAELVFHTNPMSRGRTIRWMLEEIGVPPSNRNSGVRHDDGEPRISRPQPMGKVKVPAIRHGSAVVTESAAICADLADASPEARMAPPLSARAGDYRWPFFAAGPLEAASIDHFSAADVFC